MSGTGVVDDGGLGDFTADARILPLSLMAALIGVVSAFVALALVRLIGLCTHVFYYHEWGGSLVSPTTNRLGLWAVLIPVTGGLLVGLMARFGTEQIRGHGIPEALEAILIGRSRMSARVAVLKPLSSAISIGTGGPFGAEGPIIMTGGAFGSLFAQAFQLSEAERKTLLVAGAAGGMAAVFATPVAAVLIAVELLLFEWKPRSFIPVATAAAVAGLVRVPLLGAGPMFPVPPHTNLPLSTLGVGLGIGLAAGFGSGLLTWLVYACEDLFRKLPIHWMWWPVLGGLVVGVGGLFYPRALGVGYDTIHDLLAGQLVGRLLLGLLLTKALIWAVALGSGTSGGVLAPLLIMGGSLGALEAHWIRFGNPGLWAAISMGAMMGGTMRSPFTASVFVLELTHDIQVLPSLFVACVAADAVTVLLMKRSILTEKVARRGTHVMREYIVSPLHQLCVEDVMERDVPAVPASLPVDTMFRRLANVDPIVSRRQAWPLVDDHDRLIGIITRGDLVRALERLDGDGQTVLDAGTRSPLVVTYPDELLERATQKMLDRDIGRLPVVSREDPTRLVGYLGRTGIMAAWLYATQQERVQEDGWLTEQLRVLKSKLRTLLAGRGRREPP
ncbi:MAG TPA: chloride channel protein [Gemmatimonadales bacterium]|nr:chloride channel protein [Gemmatimonadales bacterium]